MSIFLLDIATFLLEIIVQIVGASSLARVDTFFYEGTLHIVCQTKMIENRSSSSLSVRIMQSSIIAYHIVCHIMYFPDMGTDGLCVDEKILGICVRGYAPL